MTVETAPATTLDAIWRDHAVPGVAVGQQLLAAARGENADLLVMGGYGKAPWREMLLGGATRQVIGSSLLPILIAH